MTAALAALRAALAEALAEAGAIEPDDDIAAMRFVTGLDEALADLPALLAAMPGLLASADLGPDLVSHFTERSAGLARLRERLRDDSAALARLRPVLDGLRTAAAEHAAVAAELAELRRLQNLAGELDELRARTAAFEDRRRELSTARDAEDALAAAAGDLLGLVAGRLEDVREEVRRAAAEAAAGDAELTETRRRLDGEHARLEALDAELRTAEAGFAALRADSELRLPALRLYRQADQALVEGLARGSLVKLSGLQRARDALDLAERALADVDAALGPALELYDRAHAEARRSLPLT
ncbi:hypothetical protein [Actinomadura sp. GTD37]|uniref:hypothetical protein n=1 Tax=Actinomadura sp. GTD37 TaxID=1778030 RepID=UPI0035BFC6E1